MPPKRNFWPLLGLGICVGTAICTATILFALWVWMKPVGGFSPDLPPKQYRGDTRVQVRFTDHAEAMCGIIKAPRGSIACAPIGGDLIIAPNPCKWRDPYAKMMCHEKAHALGWPAEHPR